MWTPANASRVKTAVPCLSVHSPGSELRRMDSLAMRHLQCASGERLPVLQNEIDFADDGSDVGKDSSRCAIAVAGGPRIEQGPRADRDPQNRSRPTVGQFQFHRLADVANLGRESVFVRRCGEAQFHADVAIERAMD